MTTGAGIETFWEAPKIFFVILEDMPKGIHRNFAAVFAFFLCLATTLGNAQQLSTKRAAKVAPAPEENPLPREIRHQLLVLPYYSVFDYIVFTLDSSRVTLTGHVLRPTLRTDAEAAVKSIEGVTSVNNLIEVLPRSSADDNLRRAVYRAVFEDSVLQRYAVSEVPAIHIILKDGAVTLEGAVLVEGDKNLAGTRAASVAGVSGVKNNLSVHAKDTARN